MYQRSTLGERILLEQFRTFQIVGRGTFGKVYLIYLPHTETAPRKFFALKSMRKDVILSRGIVDSVKLERLIMLQVDHPFLVSMQYVFQRSLRVYFVMDFMSGGELFHYMQTERRFSQSKVQFYVA